jgi:uncharacterized membrane protein
VSFLPPMPGWDGLHPLIVHFPIALLLVAPLFVLIGAFLSPEKGKPFFIAGLLLMVLGTISMFVASSTGEAARRVATKTPQIRAVLEQHEDLAETTEVVFAVLTVAFGALLFVPGILRRQLSRKLGARLLVIFFLGYVAGAVLLADAAHQGGVLVHDFGVRARTAAGPAPVPTVVDKEQIR